MRIHGGPVSCAECRTPYLGQGDELGQGVLTGAGSVYVGLDSGWIYFGDPLPQNHEDDKHLCPRCAAERHPILVKAINEARGRPNIAVGTFHPPSLETTDAINFALEVSKATIGERQSMGPDFGIERFVEEPNDASKVMLCFGDRKDRVCVEVMIADVEAMRWQSAAQLLRSTIAQHPRVTGQR